MEADSKTNSVDFAAGSSPAATVQAAKGFSLDAAMEHFERLKKVESRARPWRLTIRKHNPGGLSAHQTTEVKAIYGGFDWQAGQVIIEPANPLTELSPEDVAAIHKSMAQGSSWHAYKREEAYTERFADALGIPKLRSPLQAAVEAKKLRAQRDELLHALEVLLDEQNDAPLENRRAQWQAACDAGRAAVRKVKEV